LKEGKGELIYKQTSDFYKGDFKKDLITGEGIYKWSNEDTYEGTFVDGKMHGRGIYRWPDNSEYVGDYIDNIKEGWGTFKWKSGRTFTGPFVKGKPHGMGKMSKNGKSEECEFIDGVYNKDYKQQRKSIQFQVQKKCSEDVENF
jgi:hypothetical protein